MNIVKWSLIKEQRQYNGAKNLDVDVTPSTKIKSKWITVLNVKHKTINPLDDKVGDNLDDLGYGDYFLGMTNGMIHERRNW